MEGPTGRDAIGIVRRIYDAFGSRDLDAIVRLTDPEIVFMQDAALPWGGNYVGHDGIGHFMMALVATVESEVKVHELFQAGDTVIQYGRTVGTVRATGAPFDVPECHVWKVRDGRAVEARYYVDSGAVLGALAEVPDPDPATAGVALSLG
jgi:uncharacterized protein